jgi:hypothetical protein
VISSLIGLLNASNMVVITSILMATAVLSQIILFVGTKKIKHLVTGEHPVVAH